MPLGSIDSVQEKTCPLCGEFQFNGRLERHHYEWVPEPKVIRVCPDCHKRIHHEDGYHDDLLPEYNRTEAREMGVTSEFADYERYG